MKTASKEAQAAWEGVCRLSDGEAMIVALRTAQRILEDRNASMVDATIDNALEGRTGAYLLAVRGDGAIGALSRAAEAISFAFPSSATRTLAGEGDSPISNPRDGRSNLSDLELGDVGAALDGDATNFTTQLLRLIAKADPLNRERLRVAYPEAVAAWEKWRRSEKSR
jgi:hypothetical protein